MPHPRVDQYMDRKVKRKTYLFLLHVSLPPRFSPAPSASHPTLPSALSPHCILHLVR